MVVSSSCLWKRTWVKNSRVPWSPKAAKLSASTASGPEQVSTSSASTVTVHEATHGVPAIIRYQRSSIGSPPTASAPAAGAARPGGKAGGGVLVLAAQARNPAPLHLVHALGPLAGLGV